MELAAPGLGRFHRIDQALKKESGGLGANGLWEEGWGACA